MSRLSLSSEVEIQEEYNEDDDYFSVEPIDNDENKEDQDVTEVTTASEVPADDEEIPTEETTKKSEDNTSIHSREDNERKEREEVPKEIPKEVP